jgi:hypothetical protein
LLLNGTTFIGDGNLLSRPVLRSTMDAWTIIDKFPGG